MSLKRFTSVIPEKKPVFEMDFRVSTKKITMMNRLYINHGQELTKIFRAVSNVDVVTSLDLAAVDAKSPAGQADWQTILSNTLPFVDLFVPSIEELLFMLDREKYEQFIRDANGKDLTMIVNVLRDVKPLAERALQLGAKIVMIKCGEPGFYFKTADRDKISLLENKLGFSLAGWSNRDGFEASYVAEHVVSATGAGDVTIAAFLTSLLSEYPLETCLNYATASGACCVEAYDSLSGLKSLKEIQEKIDAGWKKRNCWRNMGVLINHHLLNSLWSKMGYANKIDVHIEVPRVDYEKLSGDRVGEPSECIRARVQAARNIQLKRFSQNGSTDIICNAGMRVEEILQFCKLPEDGQSLMRAATPCCA